MTGRRRSNRLGDDDDGVLVGNIVCVCVCACACACVTVVAGLCLFFLFVSETAPQYILGCCDNALRTNGQGYNARRVADDRLLRLYYAFV